MDELRPGLWHWQAPHPWWSESASYAREVSSYALDDGTRLLLFDPLAVPEELLALERELVVLLTAPWHERDAETLAREHGAVVVAPPAETAEDFMRVYGVTAEEAGDGSPDLRWLREGGGEARWYRVGETPVPGVEAVVSYDGFDHVLWLAARGLLVAGDLLSALLDPSALDYKRRDVERAELITPLLPLLDLPVELVLPAHGSPTGRDALISALS